MAAEVTVDEYGWQCMVGLAEADPLLAELLPLTATLRRHMAGLPLHHRDGFWFTPEHDWPALSVDVRVREMLDTTFADTRTWSQYPNWRWARRTTRWMAARLLRDAVLLCAIPALVAFGRDPARELDGVLSTSPAVQASLGWAAEVLADPLLPTGRS